MQRVVKTLGVAATVGMFLVLIMGATVTNTGSEHGCGKSWPLCHGKLIPQMAVSTMIEFSHRAVVGAESCLILALAAGCLLLYRRRREMQILVGLMVGFLFLQAGLGAWAVMYPQLSAVLALHFGVSLIAFASVLLTTVFLFEVDGVERLRTIPAPRGMLLAVWGLAAYSYVVVYLGAYVRHTHADHACKGWPTCNGSTFPALQGAVGTNFGHRLAAGVLILCIVGLALWTSRVRDSRPDLFWGAMIALSLVVLQAVSGAVVAWTGVDIFSALLHAGLVGLMFGALTYLCVHVLPLQVREARERSRVIAASEPVHAQR